MGLEGIASSLPAVLAMLPGMILYAQLGLYLFLIWTYGSMSMAGCHWRRGFAASLGCKALIGSVALVGGLSFSAFVPYLGSGILGALQADVLAAGLATSLVLLVSLRLLTHGSGSPKPAELAERLRKKVEGLEGLLKDKAKAITQKDAFRLAEKSAAGYKAEGGKLSGHEWTVDLKKGSSSATVVLDAWDGEVKKVARQGSAARAILGDGRKALGIVLMAAVILASLFFFRGFPDPEKSFEEFSGISMGDVRNLSQSLGGLPAFVGGEGNGCVSPVVFAKYYSQLRDQEFVKSHLYTDPQASELVRQGSGEDVAAMVRIEHEDKDLVLAFTTGMKTCWLTDGVFCGCIDATQ